MKVLLKVLFVGWLIWLSGQSGFGQNPASRIDSLQKKLMELPADSLRFETLYALGNAFKATNFQKSRAYATEALHVARQLHLFQAEADAYNLIGSTYREEGDFLKAKQYTLQALRIREKLGKPKGLYQSYNNLGYIIFEGEGNMQQALAYYEKARSIAINAGLTAYLPENYNQIGLVYKRRGKLGQARTHFIKAVQLGQALPADKQNVLSAFYNNLSKVALDQGKPDEGLRWVKLAMRVNQRFDNQRSQTFSLENAGRIYAYQHNLQHAASSFKAALDLASKLKATNRIHEIYQSMSESYEHAGQPALALTYYKLADKLSDSLFTAQKAHQLTELQVQYETEKKEEQIRLLDQENVSRLRQVSYLGGGAGLLVLLLGGMGLQYHRIRRTKARLQKQSLQLELLMKELHHRVKNNLAIVSGLLNLQSYQMHDKEAIEAIRRGQQRIEAMSLIHQKLYQTDKLTRINVREYLLNLTESLLRVYGYSPNDFDLTLDVIGEWLDVDLAIPVGLIANELITNSLKYAYQETARPALRVMLKTEPALVLEVADNGPGFDMATWKSPTGSFGKQLIKALGNQLGAHLNICMDNGTCIRLSVPKAA